MDLVALASTLAMNLASCSESAGLAAQSDGAAQSAESVEVPGGILDGSGKVLYLDGVKPGVVAVDAESGAVLWECADVNTPLALLDDRLAVLADEPGRPNVLRVRFLRVDEKGVRDVESGPLSFPEWVHVRDRWIDGSNRTFELRASRLGGELHLRWKASTSYRGGVPAPPEVLEAHRRSAAGLAVVDPRSGGVTMRSLPAEDEASAVERWTPVHELPQPVMQLARRENWLFARVVGARAFGRSIVRQPGRSAVYSIQAVELATGRLLWQRPIEEERLCSLPP